MPFILSLVSVRKKDDCHLFLFFLFLTLFLKKLIDYSYVQQPVSVQTPPPVDPAAQATNRSSPAPALSPDQARKPGQNFKCLWQACKR